MLERSVQRGGARLRVNVQLVDAETGTYLWADRFDKPVADLFEMQDEVPSPTGPLGIGRGRRGQRQGLLRAHARS